MDSSLDPASVVHDFEEYVNPALSQVLKFIGFSGVESHARGCLVWDTAGRKYLDCLGGYGTMSVGHSHPRVIAAVQAQLEKMSQASRVLFNAPQAALAKKLAQVTPGELQYSFFCNSGTEAAEAAIKFARITTGRAGLVSTEGAYHGKTMGALSISGRDKYKKPFAPLIEGTTQVPFNNIEALEAAVSRETAAILIEPVQGEGGIHVACDEYLRAAREVCDRHGALLVFDEVQCGLGRTGKWWGCDWAGVEPDMMLLAKALSGACVPIGAVVAHPKVWKFWNDNPLIHSSTFGGGPLACAAGLAALQVLEDENLIENSRVQGEKLMARLKQTQARFPKCVREVRGRGLMIGVEFPHEDVTGLVLSGMAGRDVLVVPYTFNNATVTRFEPPLMISDEEIDWAARAFEEAVQQTSELIEDSGLSFDDGESDEEAPEE